MSKEKEVMGSAHFGEVVRVGDLKVRRGTVVKTEDNILFFLDHELPQGRDGKKAGTIVANRVITAPDGTMLGRSPRKTMIDPDREVTPSVMMLYSMADRLLPVIPETRGRRNKKESDIPGRRIGFDTRKK